MTTYMSAGIEDQLNPEKRRLVALDVDGTLVDHDGLMSPAVRESARAAIAAGHQLVIATGRSLGAVLPILQLLDLQEGYCVCSNGALTLRLDPTLEGGTRSLSAWSLTRARL